MKTRQVKNLAEEVLATLGPPHTENAIDEVCVAIETRRGENATRSCALSLAQTSSITGSECGCHELSGEVRDAR